MANAQTPEAYTDPQTGKRLLGYPILDTTGNTIGHTPLSDTELEVLANNVQRDPANISTAAKQAAALADYEYNTAGSGAVTNEMRSAAVQAATGKETSPVGAGVAPVSSVILPTNTVTPKADTASTSASLRPDLLSRPTQASRLTPKIETDANGNKIVTVDGNYLNNMLQNFYKAGAASVHMSNASDPNQQPVTITQDNAVPNNNLSPSGRIPVSYADTNSASAQGALARLKANPAYANMSSTEILQALRGPKK